MCNKNSRLWLYVLKYGDLTDTIGQLLTIGFMASHIASCRIFATTNMMIIKGYLLLWVNMLLKSNNWLLYRAN